MLFELNKCLKIVFLLLCCTKTILAECKIEVPENPLTKPQLRRKIGSREISVTNTRVIIIQNLEELHGNCDIAFEKSDDVIYTSKRDIFLKCEDNRLRVNGNSYGNSMIFLECTSMKWNLYESAKQFSWCPSNMVSYILARPIDGAYPYRTLAGICFDIDNMTLNSLYYTMAPTNSKYWYPAALLQDYKPNLEIKFVKETFANKSITNESYDNLQFQELLQFANYEFNSIIQNPTLYDQVFNQFGSLLDFAWWPNLRLGNWKVYEDALARNVKNQNQIYDILSGISGKVMAPVKENCEYNYTLRELADRENRKLPLYVWNYLQPRDDSNNEIVVIGVNSPFYEFHLKKDIVFCTDICNEIEWLKNVRTSFRYSTLGVIFCCKVEDVISSKILNGFSEDVLGPLSTKTSVNE